MTEGPEFLKYINLAAEKLGAQAISCSDDFFASMHNLVRPGRGVFIADKYTENGKWMDGWESRRKRDPGHDWCIIKLGTAGIIKGFDVDTNHFLGNHPPFCSIEACFDPSGNPEDAEWHEVLEHSPLFAGSQNFFECTDSRLWTHLRLNIFPDGGVARIKVYGIVQKDWSSISEDNIIDLAAAKNGAKCIDCNDMFFSHMDNLIMPGKGVNMGDGWETKRNRTPDNQDWVIIRLAHKGRIKDIEVDTHHFKGNYPDSFIIEGCVSDNDELTDVDWTPILPRLKLSPNNAHFFKDEILCDHPFTHIKLSIFPDGGISRLRLKGTIC